MLFLIYVLGSSYAKMSKVYSFSFQGPAYRKAEWSVYNLIIKAITQNLLCPLRSMCVLVLVIGFAWFPKLRVLVCDPVPGTYPSSLRFFSKLVARPSYIALFLNYSPSPLNAIFTR